MPDKLFEYASSAEARGLQVIVAGAGGAAHLPGMAASKTLLPVLGVPVESRTLQGLDSLLSINQMPAGVPVAQPGHGAFTELIESTGGGLIVQPDCVEALCDAIQRLKSDPEFRARLGREGCSRVHSNHSIDSAATEMQRILFE